MVVGAIIVGFILDAVLGDPHWLPHPVRLMGRMIAYGEKICRPILPANAWGELAGGALLVAAVTTISFAVPWLILRWAAGISGYLAFVLECVMCYQILAARSLKVESMAVAEAVKDGDLAKARQRVAMIVGRDTANLSMTGVIKAAVETVAENTSDGVIAPLFFLAIGGAPLGFWYKSVNTMDSMLGYRNERYQYFGRAAARLDDGVNFVPARLAAILLLMAGAVQGYDARRAWQIFRRDRFQHKSPNSAQTEAVCAGLLGVQLAGDAYYFGVLHHKPTIGDDLRAVEAHDIERVNNLMYGAAVLAVFLCCAVRVLIGWQV